MENGWRGEWRREGIGVRFQALGARRQVSGEVHGIRDLGLGTRRGGKSEECAESVKEVRPHLEQENRKAPLSAIILMIISPFRVISRDPS